MNFEREKKYTKEEIKDKFPEIAGKTKELQIILDWFNSAEAKKIAPDKSVRKELHYRSVEGTDLKTPHDSTGSMHIGEAVRKRYIDLFAMADTTEEYKWNEDSARSEALQGAEGFLLDDLSPEERNRSRTELEKEIEEMKEAKTE